VVVSGVAKLKFHLFAKHLSEVVPNVGSVSSACCGMAWCDHSDQQIIGIYGAEGYLDSR